MYFIEMVNYIWGVKSSYFSVGYDSLVPINTYTQSYSVLAINNWCDIIVEYPTYSFYLIVWCLGLLTAFCSFYKQKQPEIHLFAARFKEQTGDLEGARAEYQLLYSDISPGLLEAIVRHANMEYRLVLLFNNLSIHYGYFP